MSKEIHKDVRPMKHITGLLGITTTDIVGMICSGDCTKLSTVLVSEDATIYEKHREKLEGDDMTPILNYKDKKAFIMAGSTITSDKMKLELKEHKIKITNNPDDADLFISNNYLSGYVGSGESLSLKQYMFKISNGYAVTEWEEDCGLTRQDRITEWMQSENIEHVILDNSKLEVLNTHMATLETDSLPYDTYVYTGIALQILDRVHNHGATIIHEDRIMKESPNQQVLTEELLQTILDMYNAGNEDRLLLDKILPTIRTDINHHLIWKLSHKINRYSLSSRNKDLDYWMRKSKFENYARMSAEDFIIQHDENNLLTSEGFKYVEPIVRQDININNRELYVFKVQIKPELANKYLTKKKKANENI